ncbi:MAG: DNA repair exonuclease [Coprococcus eutactus]|nr:DNA repair exonuclease [Coprococcus eutactus]
MRFIHVSDVHLGMIPDKGKPWSDVRAKEIEETFDRILDIAKERKVDLLLIAGNLYHSAPKAADLAKLDAGLAKLTNTRTVIIAGSSDYIESGSPSENYEFTSNTVLLPAGEFSNAYFEDINTCVTGFSYGQAEYTEDFSEGIDAQTEGAVNILLMHGGDASHSPFNFRKLADTGFDYVALGHLRKPKHMVKNRMAYPGSPEPLSPSDTGKHGFIYGQIINGETRIKWEPVACRNYINLGLEIKPEYTDRQIEHAVLKQIDKMGTQNIYRVILKGQKGRGVRPQFDDVSQDYKIYEVVDNTMFEYNADGLKRDNEHNVLGRFIAELSGEDDEVSKKALEYGLEAIIATGEK